MFVLDATGKYKWQDDCPGPYPRSGNVRAVCRCQAPIEWNDGVWTHVDISRTHAEPKDAGDSQTAGVRQDDGGSAT